ncbi:MAG: Rieske [2Fe-2S] iron-sulfur protein [Myxococcales bacterium]|nr:Rieske [2Fe-2S] iron-sulfur protein [Myxococcales bacterium]
MSCQDCLSRREFLTKSTLAVAGVAALATGCGDGQIGGSGSITAPNLGTLTLKVSTVPALATVGQLALLPTDRRVAIKRTGASSFLALSTTCTHEGTTINIVNNTSFQCPNHGARYDSDGNVTRQPDPPGSATKLPSFITSYDAATDLLTITAVTGGGGGGGGGNDD